MNLEEINNYGPPARGISTNIKARSTKLFVRPLLTAIRRLELPTTAAAF